METHKDKNLTRTIASYNNTKERVKEKKVASEKS
jgi:hypothetical protein